MFLGRLKLFYLLQENMKGEFALLAMNTKNTKDKAVPIEPTNDVFTKYRSPNCKDDKDETVLFTYFGHTENDEYDSTMVSCQTSSFETPDEITLKHMKEVTANELDGNTDDVLIEAHSVRLAAQNTKNAAKDVVKYKMASNCAPHYNLNNVTTYNKFECRYLGTGLTESGKEVMNPFQTWKGTLPSCDNTMEITDDLESDVRKLAYDAAGGDDAKLDVNKFLCSIISIPT